MGCHSAGYCIKIEGIFMNFEFFNSFFSNVDVPVIVCTAGDALEVVYENRNAKLLLNPLAANENWESLSGIALLTDLLKMPEGESEQFHDRLANNENIVGFDTMLELYSGEKALASISVTKTEVHDAEYLMVYIYSAAGGQFSQSNAQALATVFNLASKAKTTDEAINNVLAFAGDHAGVSRSYIFESVSDTMTSNTYEWCAPGVDPAIEQLQNLPKDEYSYDDLISNGLAITDDIRQLSEEDRLVLEPQGIKSLAIIPILSQGVPLGYVGFDDCTNYRTWEQSEIQLLCDIADMLASLLVRRNTERSLRYSLEIMHTVTDNSDNIVYVTDIHTDELLFVNNTVSQELGIAKESLLGEKCWKVFSKTKDGMCDYCPLGKMLDENGTVLQKTYIWEHFNVVNQKWYLVRDSIIKWTDGRDVHIETATDITKQKAYEAQLEYYASTDTMTGIYNREWGRQLIENILEKKSTSQKSALAFIDLDGLKLTNDKYGHEAGDRMIQKTVNIIQSSTRKSDVLCRWGGDEFIMILRGDKEQAEFVMKKIQSKMREYNETREEPFDLSFSYGIAEINPESEQTIDDIVSIADKKMYKNKMNNRAKGTK